MDGESEDGEGYGDDIQEEEERSVVEREDGEEENWPGRHEED